VPVEDYPRRQWELEVDTGTSEIKIGGSSTTGAGKRVGVIANKRHAGLFQRG